MPQDRSISGLIMSKVSKVSQGLSHISTTIDSDWAGPLLIAITNHSRNTIKLPVSEPFCTVVFLENKSPASKSSRKPPGRFDILVRQMSTTAGKAEKRGKFKIGGLIAIIAGFAGIGYAIFGNEPGFIAMTAAGIALAEIIRFLIMKR